MLPNWSASIFQPTDQDTPSHPADSQLDLYEKFVQTVIAKVQANPALWQSTAIFVSLRT